MAFRSVVNNNGPYPDGMAVKASRYTPSEDFLQGADIIAQGNDAFSYNFGGTLNSIRPGYDEQEITVYVNGVDMTLNFDWLDVGGRGASRLIGNGNADLLIKAGGMWKARFRANVGWFVYAFLQPF